MKFCPQCLRKFPEAWTSFCSDDGTPLVDDLTPAADPNWDPKIRDPGYPPPSERETQWLPRQPPMPGAWVAPDERPPMVPVWQPPPPPFVRVAQKPSQATALASMIIGIFGLLFGGCFGPIPAIVALVIGLTALSQIKRSPETNGGKPFAIAGVVIGALTITFYVLLLIWFLFALRFG